MDTWQELWRQFALIGILALPLIVIYYIFLVRAVLEMLRRSANPILMTFAFVSLIPIPIIWKIHKKAPQAT